MFCKYLETLCFVGNWTCCRGYMDTVRRLWEDCFDSLNNKTAALSRTFNKKQRQKAAQQQPPQQINHPQVNHPQQINHPQQVNHPHDSLGGHNISININDTSNNRHEVDPPENDEEFESKYENLIVSGLIPGGPEVEALKFLFSQLPNNMIPLVVL